MPTSPYRRGIPVAPVPSIEQPPPVYDPVTLALYRLPWGQRACGRCEFWSREDAAEWGECRRRSPLLPATLEALWPRTRWDHWCGEYEPQWTGAS